MIVGKRTAAAGLAAAVLSLFALTASATDLTPSPPADSDPNGPPPMPPPMPAPGAPGSAAPPPPAASTEAHLATSDAEDNGIGLKLFYVQPEIGYGWASLGGTIPLPASSSQDFSKFRSGSGPMAGLGIGGEFITFRFGGRLRAISTPHWNLWNAGGEVLYQPGSGRFWPHVGLAVGYAWAAKFDDAVCGSACGLLDVSGLSVGARAGFQYYLTKTIEVGADATLDWLKLSRPGINGNSVYGSDASGTGGMIGVLGHLGVHLP